MDTRPGGACDPGAARRVADRCFGDRRRSRLLQPVRQATPVDGYLGLNPSEHSSGATVRRGTITKTGNALARTCLVEAAWTYRFPARVTQIIRDRLKNLPEPIRNVAWKAQVRLSARYRKLIAAGKPAPKAVVAIARELVGFIWAIARMVEPKFA